MLYFSKQVCYNSKKSKWDEFMNLGHETEQIEFKKTTAELK